MAGVRLPEDHQEPNEVTRKTALLRGAGRSPASRVGAQVMAATGADTALRRRACARPPPRVAQARLRPARATTPARCRCRPGFHVTAFGAAGSPMSRRASTPTCHDGTTCVGAGNGRVRLIRNHEGYDLGRSLRPGQRLRPGRPGRRHHLALRHPHRGAGRERAGPERHRQQLQRRPDAVGQLALLRGVDGRPARRATRRSTATSSRCRSASREPVDPVPIKAMGRFEHEACAIDPRSGIVYMTEDNGDPADGFYRYLPDVTRQAAPRRQAADARGRGPLPLRSPTRARRSAASSHCEWVDIDDPDPSDAEDHPDAVFEQGVARGAAQFMGLEGCHWSKGSVYFVASEAGDEERGPDLALHAARP